LRILSRTVGQDLPFSSVTSRLYLANMPFSLAMASGDMSVREMNPSVTFRPPPPPPPPPAEVDAVSPQAVRVLAATAPSATAPVLFKKVRLSTLRT
jgi:hypothetical protein